MFKLINLSPNLFDFVASENVQIALPGRYSDDYEESGGRGSPSGIEHVPNQADIGEPMLILLPAGHSVNKTSL